jgi:TRAP-type C4-dicarboxylate transport system substrate-binding protein
MGCEQEKVIVADGGGSMTASSRHGCKMRKEEQMKKRVMVITALLIAVVFMLGHNAPAQGAPVVLKASMFFPYTPLNVEYKSYADWCRKMSERSKGELVINFVGGGEVISVKDQVEALRNGVIDLSLVPSGVYRQFVPELSSVGMVSELTALEERKAGFVDWMNQRHMKHGMVYLGRYPGGGFVFYSNKLVNDPRKDFKGLKWGVTGTMWNGFCIALGMVPAFVPPEEKYAAMERNVIDGLGVSTTGAISLGFHEVSKYRIDQIFWKAHGTFNIMGLKGWNKLSKPLQNLLVQEQIRLETDMPPVIARLVTEERQKMIDKGVKMTTFSPEDAKWYVNLADETKWNELKKDAPDSYVTLRDMLTRKK